MSKELPFGRRLILNQWLFSLLGAECFCTDELSTTGGVPYKQLVRALQECETGMNSDNMHKYCASLASSLGPSAKISEEELYRHELHISAHTREIGNVRARRGRPITWKYFQWMALLFTDIYLDRYFADPATLLRELNTFTHAFNDKAASAGYTIHLNDYDINDLNRLCIQTATGSGKTLLMHVNILQLKHYAGPLATSGALERALLITPNEALSEQHDREFVASGIRADRLTAETDDLLLSTASSLDSVQYTEVTKLGERDGPNTMNVRNLGDRNVLLIDEAHRGLGGKDITGWLGTRARLCENGFAFEYSATFKEAASATRDSEVYEKYSKAILFDYSCRQFYEDGYGKDYRIFNLPMDTNDIENVYLTVCLLSYFQQLRLFLDTRDTWIQWNLEKPLWVFVGSSVVKGIRRRDDAEVLSDIARILRFVAWFLDNDVQVTTLIERILFHSGRETGLLDTHDGDVFGDSFTYLRNLCTENNWNAHNLLDDIYRLLFHTDVKGTLVVSLLPGSGGEVSLKVGSSEMPFGLINVGDSSGLARALENDSIGNIVVRRSEFSDPLFAGITDSSSSINLLIGSKKFIEGWDCWRVSTLGLMHVGKNEGAQVIQLFGRGVRLKGYNWTLQRSGFSNPRMKPKHIEYLETLNIFGIDASFVARFREYLVGEGMPTNENRTVIYVPMSVTYDFGRCLKVLRPRYKDSGDREFDFEKDGAAVHLSDWNRFPNLTPIEVNWYARIEALESRSTSYASERHYAVFGAAHLRALNYAQLYFRLERFKRNREFHNLLVDIGSLREQLSDSSWYRVAVPESTMALTESANALAWQEIAGDLLEALVDRLYKRSRRAFIEPRLEIRVIQEHDGSLPSISEYELVVDSNEAELVRDIEQLVTDINDGRQGLLGSENVRGCSFGCHLYEPVLHVAASNKIRIASVGLNQSEFQFVDDLRIYVDRNRRELCAHGVEVFLLRNESRGKGVGFFEAGSFYPDFLLWLVKHNVQYLTFVEPHGLIHEGPNSPKMQFYKIVKDIEARLSPVDVVLNSFILTPTLYRDLHWGESLDQLASRHVLFMRDQHDVYIGNMLSSILSVDLGVHD